MKCSIIRDLLPLYEEDLCSKNTCCVVEEHIKNCEECMEIYKSMKESIKENINIDEIVVDSEDCNKDNNGDREFWRRYYKTLFLKGIGIFLAICIIFIFIFIAV